MQRILMILVVGLLAVGCGKSEPTEEEKQVVEDITSSDWYERKDGDGATYKLVFQVNGIVEKSRNGLPAFTGGSSTKFVKQGVNKWSIVYGEIHVQQVHYEDPASTIVTRATAVGGGEKVKVYRINTDKSITEIANIFNGERTEALQETTWKRIVWNR